MFQNYVLRGNQQNQLNYGNNQQYCIFIKSLKHEMATAIGGNVVMHFVAGANLC